MYFLSGARLGHLSTYLTGDFQRFCIIEGYLEYNLKSPVLYSFNILNLWTQCIELCILSNGIQDQKIETAGGKKGIEQNEMISAWAWDTMCHCSQKFN